MKMKHELYEKSDKSGTSGIFDLHTTRFHLFGEGTSGKK